MPKKPQKLFVGMPRKISQGNSNGFFRKKIEENFPNGFFGNVKRFFSGRSKRFFRAANSTIFFRTANKNFPKFGNKLVTKRVAKDIDPTRVKRIELTNKDKIRNKLETQAHFPQESPSFLQVLRKTILDYFLPFPPAPPLDDKRNCLPLPPKKIKRVSKDRQYYP